MDYLNPWPTYIGVLYYENYDETKATTEVMTTPFETDKLLGELDIFTEEETPYLHSIINQFVVPSVKTYIDECWGGGITKNRTVSWHSWRVYSPDNTGIEPHLHSHSLLTAVFYVTGETGQLVSMDPRGNAMRGFPPGIREDNFGPVYIDPNPGKLVIAPSFVPHYVLPSIDGLRVSIATDFFFE